MPVQFESPDLLHLLWALLFQALLLFAYWRWRRHTLKKLGSPALEQRLLLGFSERRFWIKNAMFGLSVALIAIAIANPQREVRIKSEAKQSSDVIIALDISSSMLAEDVKPSRLEKAKTFIRQLVPAIPDERLGLIFFAGEAFPQVPLSTDYESLLMFVQDANPNFITDQGTDVKTAIDLGSRLFDANEAVGAGKALILISDGENHAPEALARAKQAFSEGIVIHTISVGTVTGSTIPSEAGSGRRDYSGQIIRTHSNEPFLQALAKAGGGLFFKIDESATAIQTLRSEIGRLQKATVEAKAHTEYVSYFQWLLIPVLLLLVGEQLLWWRKNKTT